VRSPKPPFRDRPGLLLAAVLFFLVTGVVNAADGDWVSLIIGSLIAVVCAGRLWSLRRRASTDGI
jgi:ABC-type anion transport system duplicated permease subunit